MFTNRILQGVSISKQISVVLLGAGNRANVYASVSLKSPEKLKVVGIVDHQTVIINFENGATGGHGGGDPKLVLDFIDYLNGAEPSVSCATLEDSVISHHTVFKAEEARKSKKIIDL